MESNDNTTLLDSSSPSPSDVKSGGCSDEGKNINSSKTISPNVMPTAVFLVFTFVIVVTTILVVFMDMYGWDLFGSIILLLVTWIIFTYISPILVCAAVIVVCFWFLYKYSKMNYFNSRGSANRSSQKSD